MKESDSSKYLTNCCDFEFVGRENHPFYKTEYKAINKVVCLKCESGFDSRKTCWVGPKSEFLSDGSGREFLFRYKRASDS